MNLIKVSEIVYLPIENDIILDEFKFKSNRHDLEDWIHEIILKLKRL